MSKQDLDPDNVPCSSWDFNPKGGSLCPSHLLLPADWCPLVPNVLRTGLSSRLSSNRAGASSPTFSQMVGQRWSRTSLRTSWAQIEGNFEFRATVKLRAPTRSITRNRTGLGSRLRRWQRGPQDSDRVGLPFIWSCR